MSEDKTGWQVGERFYPLTLKFNVTDGALIRDVTGLEYDEWLQRFREVLLGDAPADSQDVLTGLFSVAIWRENPTWRRDTVAKYLEGLSRADVEPVGFDEPPANGGDPTTGPEENETSVSSSGSKRTGSKASRASTSAK